MKDNHLKLEPTETARQTKLSVNTPDREARIALKSPDMLHNRWRTLPKRVMIKKQYTANHAVIHVWLWEQTYSI
jgi:hypothetical protein